jgi:ribosomal protein S18 acetylase RimI-like enzyme
MEIRPLTEDDAPAWWHLRLLALRTDPNSFAESEDEHQATSLEQVRVRFRGRDPQKHFVLGLFEDQELAGMAGFYRFGQDKFQHKGRVWGVYVRRESRRQGGASALLTELIKRAWAIPELEQITLAVAATQLPAKLLYQKLGFMPYGIEPRSLKVSGEYIDDELMVMLRPPHSGL